VRVECSRGVRPTNGVDAALLTLTRGCRPPTPFDPLGLPIEAFKKPIINGYKGAVALHLKILAPRDLKSSAVPILRLEPHSNVACATMYFLPPPLV
jgi:hypothetical protein